uniref:COMM domain-containing protein 4 n=1 Tax=Timema genevievae TaxID=629358 RepID=A0A7R9JQG2_TIMGE|nr:unnamed protein product [Timema genevievae]
MCCAYLCDLCARLVVGLTAAAEQSKKKTQYSKSAPSVSSPVSRVGLVVEQWPAGRVLRVALRQGQGQSGTSRDEPIPPCFLWRRRFHTRSQSAVRLPLSQSFEPPTRRRFRFCGDLDCPDWILAEINTLAKMSSVKMKLLCQQVAKSSLGEEMDYDKVKKLTSDAKFEVGDVKASVAAVEFILTSSSRHGVEEDVLSSELQQLGLPREHSTSLVRVYSDNLTAFTSKLKSESLRRLEDVRWRVDFVSRSSRHYVDPDLPEPEVTISLRVWDSLAGLHKMHKFTTTGDMLDLQSPGPVDETNNNDGRTGGMLVCLTLDTRGQA